MLVFPIFPKCYKGNSMLGQSQKLRKNDIYSTCLLIIAMSASAVNLILFDIAPISAKNNTCTHNEIMERPTRIV